jgi:hypothetical protein
MDAWDSEKRPVRSGYNPQDVQRYCVQAPRWQKFRLSLKGLPTELKLALLAMYYNDNSRPYSKWEREVQVGNYLGALRRGGQLDMQNRVKR